MNTVEKAKTDPKTQLWEQLEASHDVMLGSTNPSQHMQPMSPQLDKDEGAIWFYTRKDSELAETVGSRGGKVQLCLINSDHNYHACLHGELQVNHSQAHIDRFWGPVVAAWYAGGKSDPKLTMLKFKPHSAGIWASSSSALKFGWEIAKANISGSEPDVGHSVTIDF